MLKLFKLSSDIMPTIYHKADDRDAALEMFRTGFDEATYEKHTTHASFKCEEITLEKFFEELPEEFQIDENTSF